MAPVPVTATTCGLPGASSTMLRLAVRAPPTVGRKVTSVPQVAPAASVAGATGQLLVAVKSPALGPFMPMRVMVRAALPVLVSVTVDGALVDATTGLGKLSVVGESATAG